ncbi:MAG: hypothetical protein L6R19_08975 [Alphaproteobacteria bacterium]|nr:hypothetical protein [Alphaproteobacteria bacterium]
MTIRRALFLLLATVSLAGPASQAPAQTPPAPKAPQAAGPPRDFHIFDADGDGLVSSEEFRKYRVKRFHGIDKNKDGWATPQEFAPPRVGAAHGAPTAGGGAGQRPLPRDAVFISLDKDSDDRLSEDEFVSAGEDAFAAIDANKDGAITPDEWNQAPRVTRGKLLR